MNRPAWMNAPKTSAVKAKALGRTRSTRTQYLEYVAAHHSVRARLPAWQTLRWRRLPDSRGIPF